MPWRASTAGAAQPDRALWTAPPRTPSTSMRSVSTPTTTDLKGAPLRSRGARTDLEVLPYRPVFGTARNGHRVLALTRAPRRIALAGAATVGLIGFAPAAASPGGAPPPTVGTPSSTTPSTIPRTAT